MVKSRILIFSAFLSLSLFGAALLSGPKHAGAFYPIRYAFLVFAVVAILIERRRSHLKTWTIPWADQKWPLSVSLGLIILYLGFCLGPRASFWFGRRSASYQTELNSVIVRRKVMAHGRDKARILLFAPTANRNEWFTPGAIDFAGIRESERIPAFVTEDRIYPLELSPDTNLFFDLTLAAFCLFSALYLISKRRPST